MRLYRGYTTKNMHYAKPHEVDRARPFHLMGHGPFLVHMVFAKSCTHILSNARTVLSNIQADCCKSELCGAWITLAQGLPVSY